MSNSRQLLLIGAPHWRTALTSRPALLRDVADRFDVISVRITDKCSEIMLVILRPDARRVQDLRAAADGSVEERAHGGPVGRCECDVGLAEAFPRVLLAYPEHRR